MFLRLPNYPAEPAEPAAPLPALPIIYYIELNTTTNQLLPARGIYGLRKALAIVGGLLGG